MPLEKRDTGFRARLKVRQQRYDGPTRATEQEAKADLLGRNRLTLFKVS